MLRPIEVFPIESIQNTSTFCSSQTLAFPNPNLLFFSHPGDVRRRSEWPCRPQGNPSCASSDGVPPELAFLGHRGVLHPTGQTGWRNRSDRSAQGIAGSNRFDDLLCVLAHSNVLTRFCVNNSLRKMAMNEVSMETCIGYDCTRTHCSF